MLVLIAAMATHLTLLKPGPCRLLHDCHAHGWFPSPSPDCHVLPGPKSFNSTVVFSVGYGYFSVLAIFIPDRLYVQCILLAHCPVSYIRHQQFATVILCLARRRQELSLVRHASDVHSHIYWDMLALPTSCVYAEGHTSRGGKHVPREARRCHSCLSQSSAASCPEAIR